MSDYQGLKFPAEVSVSCLAYLFADRFVRPMSRSRRFFAELAVVTPTSGTLVHIVDVQLQCLTTALWSLRHHGVITISDKALLPQISLGESSTSSCSNEWKGVRTWSASRDSSCYRLFPQSLSSRRTCNSSTASTSCLLTHFSLRFKRKQSGPMSWYFPSIKGAFRNP
jgi:hypothetical protein